MEHRPVALITGAGRGIGRAVALALARTGYDIAANAVTFEEPGRAAAAHQLELERLVRAEGAGFLAVPGDIADLDRHEGLLDAVRRAFGRLDLLVNNASVAPLERRDILETEPQSYDRVMAVNARGTFFLTQRAARWLVEQAQGGRAVRPAVIFITSISAEVSSPSRAEYCLSKAEAGAAARLFADRLVSSGINVYEVRPGIILTDMTAPVKDKYDRLIAEGVVPQKRWGTPEDVARAVTALAGGDFGFSTGACLEVSGGMNIRRL